MSDNTIDTLSIEINSSSRSASRTINTLVRNLEKLSDVLDVFSKNTADFGLGDVENGISQLNNSVSKIDTSTLKNASTSMRSLATATSSLNRSLAGINTSAFSALASGLRTLSGASSSIPDVTGIANLAANVSKLGNKGASQGVKNLPLLASGIQSLSGLSIPEFPNLDGLAKLIDTFNKLGGKRGSGAAINIQPMISGIKQLSQLNGITFPDASGLTALANAFSALGRKTTGQAIENIPKLATAFRGLMKTLSTAPRVSSNVIALANAMSKLSANGNKVAPAVRGLESAFDRISTKAKSISSRIIEFGKNLLLSGKHADSAGSRYSNLASKIGLLYAKFWVLIRAVRSLNGMIEIASALTEVQNVVDTTFGNMSGKLEDFAQNSIKNFGMSELSAKQFASQFQAMGTAMGITGPQVKKATEFISTKRTADGLVAGYNEASNSMADMSINLTKLAADMASFYDIEQSTVAKALQSGVMAGQTRPLRTYGLDLTEATLKQWALNNGLNANIKSMTQAEKTMLRYQYVMAQSARSQGDFARTSGTWHNQVVMLKQQLQQLAAVIGSGLIQAIKPFVMQMNAALSGLIKFAQNVVNALGKIFGWEMEVNAKGLAMDDDMLDVDTSGLDDIGDSADDATKSVGNTTDAVKKLKDQLQGFDKLNVLRTTETTSSKPTSGTSSSNKNGSGTGNSGLNSVGDGAISAGLKKTKGLFESNIDNLFDLGRYISNALADQLKKIKWEKIYEKARKFGSGLASFLNGLINVRTFKAIGKTLAGVLGTVLHFLDSFGEKFNWKNFGKSLAAGLTEFLKNIPWETALSAAKNWGQGVADAIAAFVKENDFKEVGKAVAMAIKTAITFFLTLGSGIPWEDIGKKLAEAINSAIENFPAKDFADTIDVWVQGIYDLLVTAFKNLEWDDLKDKIKEFFGNLDFKTIKILLGTLTLIKGTGFLLSVGSSLLSEISKQFIAKLAEKLTGAMAGSTVLQGAIGNGLGGAAANATGGGLLGTVSGGSIVASLAGIVGAIGGIVIAAKGMFDIWTKGWTASRQLMVVAGSGIVIAIGLIAGVLTGPVALAIAGAVAAFSFLGANWKTIKDGISKKVGELKSSWKQLQTDASNLGKDLGKEWKSMTTDFKNLSDNIGKKASSIATDLKTKFEEAKKNVGSKVGSLVSNATTKFEGMKKDLGTKMGNIKSDISGAWGNIKTTTANLVGGTKDSILTKAKVGFGSIKNEVGDKFKDIKTDISDAWGSIRDKAGSMIDGSGGNTILSKVGSGFKAVKGKIDEKIEDIKGLLDFEWKFPTIGIPYIKKPHFTWDWKKVGDWIKVPTNFHISWYKKAYDNPIMFGKPTLIPTAGGLKGFGDGNGGEMVYGHNNLMSDIRDASGSNEMTNIGNRQLANDQRIIQLLTIIAEKEFGISSRDIFDAVRSESTDYTLRTGRGAFEY